MFSVDFSQFRWTVSGFIFEYSGKTEGAVEAQLVGDG